MNRGKLGLVAAALKLALCGSAFLLAGCVPGSSQTPRTVTVTAPAGAASTQASPASVPEGSPATDGQFTFVVTKIARSKTLADPAEPDNSGLTSTAQGEFVVVYLSVKNTGTAPESYYSNYQRLVSGGTQYEPATVYGIPNDGDNINPGLAINTFVAFDVTPGLSADAIQLHGPPSGVGVLVELA